MNKAITAGLSLAAYPFSAGLAHWSSVNGRPGDASYEGAANAAIVPSDAVFGSCLELQKTAATQRLRAFAPTPLHPEMYLRVSLRLRAISGAMPSVRVAAWVGNAAGNHLSSLPAQGPATVLAQYGEVVTISAIIGSGKRTGVDLVWGPEASFAHIGIDLTGANGGLLRIENILIEDVTGLFLRDLIDMVDVRDYGALGDGSSNDFAAFQLADAAAAGRVVVVPEGVFRIAGNLTMASPMRFVGTISQPEANRMVLTRNFDLDSYEAAYGSDIEGFRRALQALFHFNDHVTFDMSGRRVEVTAPIDVAALSGLSSFANRRVLANGSLNAASSSAWAQDSVTSVATYNPALQEKQLTGVENIANIKVGSLVEGAGVGREVYVLATDLGAGIVQLSQPLYGGAGTRSYSFTRFKYMLDFSGFSQLSRFEMREVELNCLGHASGVMLARGGTVFRFDNCVFNRPKARGVTSIGTGCQGMFIDQCQFLSDEQSLPAQNRQTIALNINANDVKLRNNRVVRFKHFAVMNGTSHMVQGNHFFQGDSASAGLRLAGLVLTQTNVATVISGNYIDNCFVEWGNEHDPYPEFNNEFSFGGLSLTGNIFIASDVSPSFRWLVVKPYGPGHFLNGFTMTDNMFRAFHSTVPRVEMVDSSFAALDFSRSRDVTVAGNTFHQVSQSICNPILRSHVQNSAAATWTVDGAAFIPFGGRIRMVESVVLEGALQNEAGVNRYVAPQVFAGQGAENQLVQLRWGEALKGRAAVRMRMDVPV